MSILIVFNSPLIIQPRQIPNDHPAKKNSGRKLLPQNRSPRRGGTKKREEKQRNRNPTYRFVPSCSSRAVEPTCIFRSVHVYLYDTINIIQLYTAVLSGCVRVFSIQLAGLYLIIVFNGNLKDRHSPSPLGNQRNTIQQ